MIRIFKAASFCYLPTRTCAWNMASLS